MTPRVHLTDEDAAIFRRRINHLLVEESRAPKTPAERGLGNRAILVMHRACCDWMGIPTTI